MQTPTPGAPNDSQPWSPPPSPVEFSHPAGIHNAPFSLALSHPDPEAVIIYTLDGSEPDIENLDGKTYQFRTTYRTGSFVEYSYQSIHYTGPLPVSDRSALPNKISSITTTSDSNPNYLPSSPVKKATVVRARAYRAGIAGPASTATYFVSSSGAFNYDDNGTLDFPFFDAPVPDAVVPENTLHKRLILRQPNINEVSFCRLYQAVHGGIVNLMRYALGLGRNDPPWDALPVLTADSAFRFPIDFDKTDIVYRVTASPDLSDWSTILYDSLLDATPVPEAGHLTLLLDTTTPSRFFRLEVEER